MPAGKSSAGMGKHSPSLRMPSGIAPAVVLEPVNAALLAAKMIAICDPLMRDAVKTYQLNNQNVILADDQEVQH